MSQYKIGTVSVTNGSATITGSGTAWLANAAPGDLFVRAGDEAVYTVGSVATDGQMTLTTPYGGVTGSGVGYVLHRDFHPNGQPLLRNGDVETAAIFNAFAAAVAPVSGFGSAAYATLATTGTPTSGVPNAALGFYGLGAITLAPLATNLDTAKTPGKYRFEGSEVGVPVAGFNGTLDVSIRDQGSTTLRTVQRATIRDGRKFERIELNGIWQPWVELYHTGNAVGSVASGAIIETGTNANGTYTKFADGTMICISTVALTGGTTVAVGSVFRSTSVLAVTFPSAFISVPHCYATPNTAQIRWTVPSAAGATTVNYSFLVVSALNNADNDTVRVTAIGRWK